MTASAEKDNVENPEAHYADPKEVVKDNALSHDEKKNALKTWEQDARQLLTASNEGMPGSDEGLRSDAGNRLGEVLRAEGEVLRPEGMSRCRGGVPPLTRDEAQRFLAQAPDWELGDDAHRIQRTFRFRNFRDALALVQEIGELAETEGHHPDISFGWGYVTVSLSTKNIKGLHEHDFIMASKIDRMLGRSGGPERPQ